MILSPINSTLPVVSSALFGAEKFNKKKPENDVSSQGSAIHGRWWERGNALSAVRAEARRDSVCLHFSPLTGQCALTLPLPPLNSKGRQQRPDSAGRDV